MQPEVEVELTAENPIAQVLPSGSLGNRAFQCPEGLEILPAQEYVRAFRADRIRRDDDSLDQEMGIEGHQVAVLERPRFHFIRIADQVLRTRAGGVSLRHETPLDPGREAGTAPAAQVRILDQFDDLFRRHRCQRLARAGIAAAGLVSVDVDDLAAVLPDAFGERLVHQIAGTYSNRANMSSRRSASTSVTSSSPTSIVGA